MNRMFVLCCAILTLWCGSVYAGNEAVLARVGDREITMSDFSRILGYFPPEQQKLFDLHPENKVKLLHKIVEEMVISEGARKEGLDRTPAAKERTRLFVNTLLTTDVIKKEVLDKIEVTDADIRMYYELHSDEFRTPEMVRARHILIAVAENAPEKEKTEAREKAEDILQKLKSGGDFAKLAAEYSDDRGSRDRGGEIGFFARGRTDPRFEKVAFSLKPGEISDVVETKFGYHIIQTEEKKESSVRPLDEVRKVIKDKIYNDRRVSGINEYVENQLEKANVKFYPEALLKK